MHGYFRLSTDSYGALTEKHDLDFWYNPTYDNYYKLLNALEGMGLDVKEFRDGTDPDPRKSFFKLDQEDFKIDFLPELPGLPKFRSSFAKRLASKIGDMEVSYLSFEDLIQNKQALGRQKISKISSNSKTEEIIPKRKDQRLKISLIATDQ